MRKLGENAKAAQKKREAEGLDLHLFAGKLPVDDDGVACGAAVYISFLRGGRRTLRHPVVVTFG